MDTTDIFSTSFTAGRRTYFFDIKKTKDGDKYIKISESKRTDKDDFDRYRIMVFNEDVDKFETAIKETLEKMKEPDKAYDVEKIRQTHRQAYAPWTEQDDNRLEVLYCERKTVKELTEIFGRNDGAIRSRIKKLELKEKYGPQQL